MAGVYSSRPLWEYILWHCQMIEYTKPNLGEVWRVYAFLFVVRARMEGVYYYWLGSSVQTCSSGKIHLISIWRMSLLAPWHTKHSKLAVYTPKHQQWASTWSY